jgi:hypothetical protein
MAIAVRAQTLLFETGLDAHGIASFVPPGLSLEPVRSDGLSKSRRPGYRVRPAWDRTTYELREAPKQSSRQCAWDRYRH